MAQKLPLGYPPQSDHWSHSAQFSRAFGFFLVSLYSYKSDAAEGFLQSFPSPTQYRKPIMEVCSLKGPGESSVEIHHFGAHVTSWKTASGRDIIYTSPTAILDGSKAIRGGVPICFPQFARRGPLPQHGFARNTTWTRDYTFTSSNPTAAKFILTDSEATHATHWPFKFEAAYIVTLSSDGNSLTMEMQVSNKDNTPFGFTIALHSYYICQSESVTLSQYDGLAYDDTCDPENPGKRKVQNGDITFGKEVDRVYFETSNELSLPGLTIKKENLPDAVVWNPYVEKAAALKDMPDDDWRNFICIEPAKVGEPAMVQPGESWTCSLSLHAT